jgi:hypothetical protein
MATATKEELQERAQLVRIHEANCKIDYPSKDELNFRLAIMKSLGTALGLAAMRKVEITGPATTDAARPKPVTAPAPAARR